MNACACIFGCAGPVLTPEEAAFFREADPWGFILFARNCVDAAQIRALCADLRSSVGRHAPIFIDEEGGRVSRLRALGGYIGPTASALTDVSIAKEDAVKAVRLNYRAIGARLIELGVNVDCAPVLDLPVAGADPIISDRAFSADPTLAARFGQACLDGLADAGVGGVIKHIPGHGRANVDSHLALPRVETPLAALEKTDFLAFQLMRDALMAMTAHIIFSDIDPDRPATLSKTVIKKVIRERIGFDGLLMSDDLNMSALSGDLQGRTSAALDAGCDIVLHCNGKMDDMQAVAGACPALEGRALSRANAALPPAAVTSLNAADAQHEAADFLAQMGIVR